MSLFIVDAESDGPIPYKYSMISFGAIRVDEKLETTFYGQCKPMSKKWDPEALAISGHSREECLVFPDPFDTMTKFAEWIKTNNRNGRPIFMSDNVAYDWQFINFYFHWFLGSNPFGFSGRRIGDLFAGYNNDMFIKWKKYRKTTHNHHPVQDAKGNAEALLYLKSTGFKLAL